MPNFVNYLNVSWEYVDINSNLLNKVIGFVGLELARSFGAGPTG